MKIKIIAWNFKLNIKRDIFPIYNRFEFVILAGKIQEYLKMNINIKFTKMQGIGNDFILVEGEEIKKHNLDQSELAVKMCDRHFGIGADGLIVINPSDITSNTDTSWRILNSDGTEPQMCGNGIRCFAKYVYQNGIVNKKRFSVQTLAEIIIPTIQDNDEIMVDMGEPVLIPEKIPVSGIKQDKIISYPLKIKDTEFKFTPVSMGNPHS